MNIKNKALVLDLDDTLYSELDYLISAYQFIATKLERNNSQELYEKMFFLFKNDKNVFDFLIKNYKQMDKEQLLYWYRFHEPRIVLFNGVLECLGLLKNKYKFAIITDGRSFTQRNKIRALNIESYLDEIVISEEIGTEKPHLNNFKIVEKNLQCQSYIYVGDNPKKDFVTPNTLGWNTICLLDQGNNIHKQDFEQEILFLPKKKVNSWYKILDELSVN